MSSELLIRPAFNDHEVVADLLAPGGASVLLPGRATPIDRLVVDAHIARKRPQFATAAASVGVPVLIDPLTHFWQGELRERDSWAKLPYAAAHALRPEELAHPLRREDLIARVVDCQLNLRATSVIPPYLYARTPYEPWFERSIEMLEATARHLDRLGVRLPIFALLLAGHQGFMPATTWGAGIDRFARTARDCGASGIGVAVSPTKPADGYNKVLGSHLALARVKDVSGVPTFAWRQGIFGVSLVAAGADGYETGVATGEACDISRSMSSRRPRENEKSSGGNSTGIYIEALGRSVPAKVGRALLESSLRSKVMCDDERCCPDGPASTKAHPREHAVRMRRRNLSALDALPHITWRLHSTAKDAAAASTLAAQANQVLEKADFRERIPAQGFDAVARVARHLLAEEREANAA